MARVLLCAMLLTCACDFGQGQMDGSFWWLNGPLASQSAKDSYNGSLDALFEKDSKEVSGKELAAIGRAENSARDLKLPVDLDCECVIYFLCDDELNIITDGVSIIDERSPTTRKECATPLEICCNTPQNSTTPTLATSTPISKLPPFPTLAPTGISNYTDINDSSKCGSRTIEIGARILEDLGGANTHFGEFPWMLALLLSTDGVVNYRCGASLIHPRVAVTAAHCIAGKRPSEIIIRAGEWDPSSKAEPLPHVDRQVSLHVRHPQYYSGALYNDVALLFWDEPIPFSRHIRAICLAESGEELSGAGSCLATGWGMDDHEASFTTVLNKISLPVVTRSKCQEMLRKTRLGANFKLHESFVCAGGEQGMDTCNGDGGGPLACAVPGTDQYYLGGIVSWGIGCGDATPAMYTNMPLMTTWIQAQTSERGIKL